MALVEASAKELRKDLSHINMKQWQKSVKQNSTKCSGNDSDSKW